MAELPRDLSDVRLAPVVLAVDARLEELAGLSPHELIVAVEGVQDGPAIYRALRERALIEAVEAGTDRYGWTFSWDPRGLRPTHGTRSLVLGLPLSLARYLDGERPTADAPTPR